MKSSTPIYPIRKVTAFGFLFSLALVLFMGPVLRLSASSPNISTSFVHNLPFDNLSSQETHSLQRGERVFRVLDSYKDVSLNSAEGPGRAKRRELLSLIEDVRPNFLAEMMMVIPVDNNRDNLSVIKDILFDVEAFDNIPYYSVQNERWYDLFEDTKILSPASTTSGRTVLTASHLMKPFDPHKAEYSCSVSNNTLFYVSKNLTALRFKGFKPVRKEDMINLLWILDAGDKLVVYGAGGARVGFFFNLFGGERMDNAFIGRVDAFFSWFNEEHIKKLRVYES